MSYFPLDVNFLKDDKFAYLIAREGVGAVTIVLSLWSRMYEREGPLMVDQITLNGVARETNTEIENIKSIIETAKEVELLLEHESGGLFSGGVSKRIREVTKDRNRLRKTRTNSEQTPNKLEQTKNKSEQTPNTLSFSFSFSFSSLREVKEGVETIRRDSPPGDELVALGPELRCRMPVKAMLRVLKFFDDKQLGVAEFWRGVEILDAQLAKPSYAKQNRDHAACMTRWVYKAVLEETTVEARHKRANGSTVPSPRPTSIAEHNEEFFTKLERKLHDNRTDS